MKVEKIQRIIGYNFNFDFKANVCYCLLKMYLKENTKICYGSHFVNSFMARNSKWVFYRNSVLFDPYEYTLNFEVMCFTTFYYFTSMKNLFQLFDLASLLLMLSEVYLFSNKFNIAVFKSPKSYTESN